MLIMKYSTTSIVKSGDMLSIATLEADDVKVHLPQVRYYRFEHVSILDILALPIVKSGNMLSIATLEADDVKVHLPQVRYYRFEPVSILYILALRNCYY